MEDSSDSIQYSIARRILGKGIKINSDIQKQTSGDDQKLKYFFDNLTEIEVGINYVYSQSNFYFRSLRIGKWIAPN